MLLGHWDKVKHPSKSMISLSFSLSLNLPHPTMKASTGPNMTSFATASRTRDDLLCGAIVASLLMMIV